MNKESWLKATQSDSIKELTASKLRAVQIAKIIKKLPINDKNKSQKTRLS